MGYERKFKSMQSIGYRHIINYIDSKWTWDKTLELLARDTRHYAKRQYTWFNNDPEITWYEMNSTSRIMQDIQLFLNERKT
jgi:tRNA dimethylallyltransferase